MIGERASEVETSKIGGVSINPMVQNTQAVRLRLIVVTEVPTSNQRQHWPNKAHGPTVLTPFDYSIPLGLRVAEAQKG